MKLPRTKFHLNLSSGSLNNTRGQTGGYTDVTKLIGALCKWTNTPQQYDIFHCLNSSWLLKIACTMRRWCSSL